MSKFKYILDNLILEVPHDNDSAMEENNVRPRETVSIHPVPYIRSAF